MLSKEIKAIPIVDIASNVEAFGTRAVGILGGRKFVFREQNGTEHEFRMKDMLNYLNNKIDTETIPNQAKIEEKKQFLQTNKSIYEKIVKKLKFLDKDYEVTREKDGCFKYFLTLIRRIANIGFDKKATFEKLFNKAKFENVEAEIEAHEKKFPRINKTIGTREKPLNEEEIRKELEKLHEENKDQKVDQLIIYGDNVKFTQDPGIIQLDPKKLILINAKIQHGELDESMISFGKWYKPLFPANESKVHQIEVDSIEKAISDQPHENPKTNEPYNFIYLVKL